RWYCLAIVSAMLSAPPRPPTTTLFPYTTLFRSAQLGPRNERHSAADERTRRGEGRERRWKGDGVRVGRRQPLQRSAARERRAARRRRLDALRARGNRGSRNAGRQLAQRRPSLQLRSRAANTAAH